MYERTFVRYRGAGTGNAKAVTVHAENNQLLLPVRPVAGDPHGPVRGMRGHLDEKMTIHLLAAYWAWAGSNVGAMPACALVAGIFTMTFLSPIKKFWHKHFGPDIEDIRDAANAAHRIAADLYEKHTGHKHPDAPEDHDNRDAGLSPAKPDPENFPGGRAVR
jgi:hypothetical protein